MHKCFEKQQLYLNTLKTDLVLNIGFVASSKGAMKSILVTIVTVLKSSEF